MRAGDRVSDLQSKLEEIPPHIEELCDNMISSLDKELEHSAEIFSIVDASPEPRRGVCLICRRGSSVCSSARDSSQCRPLKYWAE
ncbi:hypothetical protein F5B21DRAFT_460120 [Xylaria acuta]|nr:hypothetical protein F5B21DRAFT_460120 [Xylaria acuta]